MPLLRGNSEGSGVLATCQCAPQKRMDAPTEKQNLIFASSKINSCQHPPPLDKNPVSASKAQTGFLRCPTCDIVPFVGDAPLRVPTVTLTLFNDSVNLYNVVYVLFSERGCRRQTAGDLKIRR